MTDQERLYLLNPTTKWASAAGRLSPEPINDPRRSELIVWDGILEDGHPKDLMSAVWPWMLMSVALLEAIRCESLTGLRVGAEAVVADFAATRQEDPVAADRQRIVVPETPVAIRSERGDLKQHGLRRTDKLTYRGWRGQDFSYLVDWDGWLVSKRALDVLRMHDLGGASVRVAQPEP